jgi:hypothetical protein
MVKSRASARRTTDNGLAVVPAPEPAAAANKDVAPDPFDPASLRLSHDFNSAAGVKKALLTVPVRKPDKSWWVRTHPDPAFRLQTALVELREERTTYLVAKSLWPELATEVTFRPKLLVTAINRQNVVFLWECNLPRQDGRADEWTRSALEAVDLATKGWIRLAANMSLGAYDIFTTRAQLTEPTWPEVSLGNLLRVAFKDRLIESSDHAVLRRLRGEV